MSKKKITDQDAKNEPRTKHDHSRSLIHELQGLILLRIPRRHLTILLLQDDGRFWIIWSRQDGVQLANRRPCDFNPSRFLLP